MDDTLLSIVVDKAENLPISDEQVSFVSFYLKGYGKLDATTWPFPGPNPLYGAAIALCAGPESPLISKVLQIYIAMPSGTGYEVLSKPYQLTLDDELRSPTEKVIDLEGRNEERKWVLSDPPIRLHLRLLISSVGTDGEAECELESHARPWRELVPPFVSLVRMDAPPAKDKEEEHGMLIARLLSTMATSEGEEEFTTRLSETLDGSDFFPTVVGAGRPAVFRMCLLAARSHLNEMPPTSLCDWDEVFSILANSEDLSAQRRHAVMEAIADVAEGDAANFSELNASLCQKNLVALVLRLAGEQAREASPTSPSARPVCASSSSFEDTFENLLANVGTSGQPSLHALLDHTRESDDSGRSAAAAIAAASDLDGEASERLLRCFCAPCIDPACTRCGSIADDMLKVAVNAPCSDGTTALYHAVSCKKVEFVETLLSLGADPRLGPDHSLPLATAKELSLQGIVSILQTWLDENDASATEAQKPKEEEEEKKPKEEEEEEEKPKEEEAEEEKPKEEEEEKKPKEEEEEKKPKEDEEEEKKKPKEEEEEEKKKPKEEEEEEEEKPKEEEEEERNAQRRSPVSTSFTGFLSVPGLPPPGSGGSGPRRRRVSTDHAPPLQPPPVKPTDSVRTGPVSSDTNTSPIAVPTVRAPEIEPPSIEIPVSQPPSSSFDDLPSIALPSSSLNASSPVVAVVPDIPAIPAISAPSPPPEVASDDSIEAITKRMEIVAAARYPAPLDPSLFQSSQTPPPATDVATSGQHPTEPRYDPVSLEIAERHPSLEVTDGPAVRVADRHVESEDDDNQSNPAEKTVSWGKEGVAVSVTMPGSSNSAAAAASLRETAAILQGDVESNCLSSRDSSRVVARIEEMLQLARTLEGAGVPLANVQSGNNVTPTTNPVKVTHQNIPPAPYLVIDPGFYAANPPPRRPRTSNFPRGQNSLRSPRLRQAYGFLPGRERASFGETVANHVITIESASRPATRKSSRKRATQKRKQTRPPSARSNLQRSGPFSPGSSIPSTKLEATTDHSRTESQTQGHPTTILNEMSTSSFCPGPMPLLGSERKQRLANFEKIIAEDTTRYGPGYFRVPRCARVHSELRVPTLDATILDPDLSASRKADGSGGSPPHRCRAGGGLDCTVKKTSTATVQAMLRRLDDDACEFEGK